MGIGVGIGRIFARFTDTLHVPITVSAILAKIDHIDINTNLQACIGISKTLPCIGISICLNSQGVLVSVSAKAYHFNTLSSRALCY